MITAAIHSYCNTYGLAQQELLPNPVGYSTENSEKAYAKYQTFSLDEWTILETAGAVFLRAAGDRNYMVVGLLNRYGNYWSATKSGTNYAYSMFSYPIKDTVLYANRLYGCSVRLVQDLYSVQTSCDAEQGRVSGAGIYLKGTEVTLKATARPGYHFMIWLDGTWGKDYTFRY